MKYKITLYNSKFYKEIKLSEEFAKGLSIGTSKDCQIRFFREQFFTDFVLRIMLQEDGRWMVMCEDSVYLKKDNAYKQYIDDKTISRKHADIITRGNKYYIYDHNSTNHTFVNNEIITPKKEVEIQDGYVIKLAGEEFVFHIY